MSSGSAVAGDVIDDIIRKCLDLKEQMRGVGSPAARSGGPKPASGVVGAHLDNIGVMTDENVDGIGISLERMGYSVKRVRSMRESDPTMADDFNVIKYAKENDLVLITRDREIGRACENNNIPCVWIKEDTILRLMIVPELERMSREREDADALG